MIIECQFCGETVEVSNKLKKYCNDSCRKKHTNYFKDPRLFMNGPADKSVTLVKLFKKEKGVCADCGVKTSFDDYVIKNGTIVVGNTYPSIDHIVPLRKGGLHRWDNVQLLCRSCNCKKYIEIRVSEERKKKESNHEKQREIY